jgi:hypothetical protein
MSYSPAALLGELGIPVLSVWLCDTWGAWSPVHRKIVVADWLTPIQRRCVLAHQVEHVLADDGGCGVGLPAKHREHRATAEAARKLIPVCDLAVLVRMRTGLREAAVLLGVTDVMLGIRLAELQGEGWLWPATSKIAG